VIVLTKYIFRLNKKISFIILAKNPIEESKIHSEPIIHQPIETSEKIDTKSDIKAFESLDQSLLQKLKTDTSTNSQTEAQKKNEIYITDQDTESITSEKKRDISLYGSLKAHDVEVEIKNMIDANEQKYEQNIYNVYGPVMKKMKFDKSFYEKLFYKYPLFGKDTINAFSDLYSQTEMQLLDTDMFIKQNQTLNEADLIIRKPSVSTVLKFTESQENRQRLYNWRIRMMTEKGI
jgi:hypothetical protein